MRIVVVIIIMWNLPTLHSSLLCAEIATDISRRLESSAHWNHEIVSNPPSKEAAPKKESTDKKAPVKKAKKGTAAKKKTSRPQQHNGTIGYNNNDDVIMSMTDANYKSTMYSYFRKLEKSTDEEDEEKLKNEVFNLLKKKGGRIYRYLDWRHHELGVVELDDQKVMRSE